MSVQIRPEISRDFTAIGNVHTAAFGGAGEARLVDALRVADALTVSLVAEENGIVVGHIAFSPLEIAGPKGTTKGLALAPVAVLPGCQNRGIGSQLIEQGLDKARKSGWEIIVVLGHHEYYPRFGFVIAKPHGIICPFEVADESFMVMELQSGSLTKHQGMVKYHDAFSAL